LITFYRLNSYDYFLYFGGEGIDPDYFFFIISTYNNNTIITTVNIKSNVYTGIAVGGVACGAGSVVVTVGVSLTALFAVVVVTVGTAVISLALVVATAVAACADVTVI
jgi:hypothetical protein